MFDVVKKLMFAKQIQLEKGCITLLGQRMVMAPASTFVYLQKLGKECEQEELINKLIYYACKVAGYKGFAKKIIEKYNLHGSKFIKWQTDVAMLGGWGGVKHIETVIGKKYSIVHFSNSPIAKLFGHSKNAVDHAIRGYTASVAELAFKEPSETIETQCQAMGHKCCEIVSKPRKNFNPNDEIVKKQLDLSGKIQKMAEKYYERVL